MPATSKSQQRLFGMIHAEQKGELKHPSAKIKSMAHKISPTAVGHFASTKHTKLPEHHHKKGAFASNVTYATPGLLQRAAERRGETLEQFKDHAARLLGKAAADLSDDANRQHVPKSDFVYKDKAPEGKSVHESKGKYPIPDKVHARAALGFAAMHHGKGSAEYKAVASKVHAKFGGEKAGAVASHIIKLAAQKRANLDQIKAYLQQKLQAGRSAVSNYTSDPIYGPERATMLAGGAGALGGGALGAAYGALTPDEGEDRQHSVIKRLAQGAALGGLAGGVPVGLHGLHTGPDKAYGAGARDLAHLWPGSPSWSGNVPEIMPAQ